MTDAVATASLHGDELANLLDWSSMAWQTPGVLRTKTGRLLMTYHMVCRDTEQMEPEERAWYLSRLDEVLKLLDEGWTVDADWWHEPTMAYPETDWDSLGVPRSVKLLDMMRLKEFEARPRHSAALRLTLGWMPPAATSQWLGNFFMTGRRQQAVQSQLAQEVEWFLEGQERFVEAMRGLTQGLHPLDANDLWTYLHTCVSWDRHPLQCPDYASDLDWQVTSETWVPGEPPRLGQMLLQPITVKTWQRQLRTRLPEALSTMPFPCRYHVRWEPMGLSLADRFLTWAERKWATGYASVRKILKMSTDVAEDADVEGRDDNDGPVEAGRSILEVRRAVRQGREVVGRLKPTVLVWAEDYVTLKVRTKMVTEVMFQQGLVARVETTNASIEWLATLPGHVQYGIRARVLSTAHLTCLIPHTHIWSGVAWNKHLKGPAVLMASTDGAPFAMTTHVGALGHIKIIGPSRMGKSALFGLLIPQSFRYSRARACLFDRDFALKPTTLLHGGHHYTLGAPGCARLHILGDIDTEGQRQWAAVWVENVLKGEGLDPDPQERKEIWLMLQRLAGLPKRQRTLTMAKTLLQVQRLKVGLEPFCEGGQYSFCDGHEDTFAWESRLLCFEMKFLLGHPRVLYAVLSYCFHKLESLWFTGDPVVIGIDEAKWLIEMALFLGELEVWLLARAKKNVSVWMALQNISDMKDSRLWQAILNNMPTTIALPNPMAMTTEVYPYYKALGLPDYAIEGLAMAQPYRDYLYHSPYGTRTFQCALSPVERIQCAASETEELALLDQLAAVTSFAALPAVWLHHHGYHDEAALLEPEGDVPCSVLSSPAPLVSSLA